MNQNEIAARLYRTPLLTIDEALTELGNAPTAHGMYSWWLLDSSHLLDVPAPPHPAMAAALLYVGIGPKSAGSRRTLRKRFKDHARGSPGGSTLRKSLASLLWVDKGWKPIWTDRATLGTSDNEELTDWMHSNLRVQWTEVPEPWGTEARVIATMSPPLNLEHNKTHAFYPSLKAARTSFTARANPDRATR